jgi:hypothetical protein
MREAMLDRLTSSSTVSRRRVSSASAVPPCGKTFCETTGTVFYKKQKPDAEIIETLALVAEGVRVASLSRVKGFKEETGR